MEELSVRNTGRSSGIKQKLIWLIAVLAMLGLDRAVKLWAADSLRPLGTMPFIPGFMRFFYTENTGAAFGIFSEGRIFLVILTTAAVIFMIWYLLAGRPAVKLMRWSLVLVIGGALGNLIDRAFQGYVVDMFEFTFVSFAIFNIADIFVTCGGVMLALSLFAGEKRKRGDKGDEAVDTDGDSPSVGP